VGFLKGMNGWAQARMILRHVMFRLMMAATLTLHRKVRMDELFDLTDAGL
jgi:hypothetical protein